MTHEEISKIVYGISRKFTKNSKKSDAFEEYRQELFVEAYTIYNENKNVTSNYMAKSLRNKAISLSKKLKLKEENVFLVDDDDTFVSKSVELSHNVEELITLSKSISDDMYKYVVAKLKLEGYIKESDYPEVTVDSSVFTEEDNEDTLIIKNILNKKNAEYGGNQSFRNSKRDLFIKLIDTYEIRDLYKHWYEVKYIDKDNNVVVDKIKDYSIRSAQMSIKDNAKELIYIISKE
jgi:hypothetical protein